MLCTYRYYDPNTGRWINRDPIGFAGGVNLYAYCNGNPVNFTDTSGQRLVPHHRVSGFSFFGVQTAPPSEKELSAFNKALKYLSQDSQFKKIIDALQKSDKEISINISSCEEENEYKPLSSSVNWNRFGRVAVEDDNGNPTGEFLSAALILGHELGHAYDDLFAPKHYKDRHNESWFGKSDSRFENDEERYVITKYEAPFAKKYKEGVRTNHHGKRVPI